jgi:hypothetical protein
MKKAKVSKYGQWKYPGQDTIIPNANGSITMKGVPYPVLGIDDQGNQQMMMPGADYQFPGNSVYEIPMMAVGGMINPCPPGKVPDGQGGCIDDLSTPPIPSSSLYPYYMENLNKFKALGLNNAEEIVGKMVKSRRTCKPGDECWEDPKPVEEAKVPKLDKGYYLIPSGNPGVAILNYRENAGNGKYISNVLGPVHARDFLNDDQQRVFFSPQGGTTTVDYDPNTSNIKIYPSAQEAWKIIDTEVHTPIRKNQQQNLIENTQKIEAEKQRLNAPKPKTSESLKFEYGGDISIPNLKQVKIKSLPKAQGLGTFNFDKYAKLKSFELNNLPLEEQDQYFRNMKLANKQLDHLYGVIFDEENGLDTVIQSPTMSDVNAELGSPDIKYSYDGEVPYVERFNKFHTFGPVSFTGELPEVRVPSGKRYSQNYIDWNNYNPQLRDSYFKTRDEVNDFYKNWYTKRATLPQFTDVANKRLAELPNVDFQPYGSQEAYEKDNPGTGGLYKNGFNAIYIPPSGFGDKNIMTHEESHYLDFNAPQSNSGVLRKEYNFNDDTLNEIIPAEYKQPSAEGSDNIYASSSIYLPFANKDYMPASNYLEDILGIKDKLTDYYYRPTEIRARLNEWRMNHNIDPLKDYTNEEMQQMIDTDVNENDSKNFDLYKIVRGRGDLLKRINDSQVSTGNKENPDEMPKAQRGLRKGENKVKKGKTLFGRPYQIVEMEAGPTVSGYERPGETTRVKTVYYKNGNVAKQVIENNERGGNETTWHDKDGKVTALENSTGYRTFSNGYFDYDNNVDFEASKRRQDETQFFDYNNKLDAFLKRAKLNMENMSSDGSQPGDSYNTTWEDWENSKSDYTRTKNPSIRKSNAKFQGGGLPDDYQDFLDYSKTAPENRRPDSEWQYGNPRQYDHYGMWDALGKPKTFEQALANYPQWQPDPGDGYYHGFSTNPNTGVWLKSHIPGESHPGDTGWMEYKDFMLSNDSNWGPKNQNLVYDPDLQRMRYVERNKQGGAIRQVKIKSLPKAQTGFLNNLSAQFNLTPTSSPNTFEQVNQFLNRPQTKESAPSVFDQVNTRIEDVKNVQPTTEEYVGDIFDQYKKMWGTSEPEEKPKEETTSSFTIPEDYYTRLMQEENSVNAGLENGRYYPYKSPEGGRNTIGYGHKLTPDDVKTNRYSKGLTKEEAIKLMRDDVNMHLHEAIRQYNNEYGKGAFDKLHPDLKVLALDFVYNGVDVNKFPNFFGAANNYSTAKDAASKKAAHDIMMKNYKRHNSATNEPLPARNMYTESVLLNLKEVGGSMPKAKVLNKSKRKQPGFQVLTDANGKYVFVKT